MLSGAIARHNQTVSTKAPKPRRRAADRQPSSTKKPTAEPLRSLDVNCGAASSWQAPPTKEKPATREQHTTVHMPHPAAQPPPVVQAWMQHNRSSSVQHSKSPSVHHSKSPSVHHSKSPSVQRSRSPSMQHTTSPSIGAQPKSYRQLVPVPADLDVDSEAHCAPVCTPHDARAVCTQEVNKHTPSCAPDTHPQCRRRACLGIYTGSRAHIAKSRIAS